MSQMGLISLDNRHKVVPLQISERLIKDLERLDSLNERDCLSTSVYYVRSGVEDLESIINPASISEDFEKFLNSLGWPVSLDSHPGYKAKLNSSFCKTTSYFADRTVEVIFNIPYVIHLPNPEASSGSLTTLFRDVSADDLVCIVWIEDILSMHNVPSKVGQSVLVYIFVHPLQNATGLYWIRIIIPTASNASGVNEKKHGKGKVSWSADITKLAENHLAFGPLVDGMIVSRHTLGSLVRNTAISAHEACRNILDMQSKPYSVRRQFIEEMHHRYKSNMSVSE
ncbi:1327_t:CDS:2 [Acaulospora colombiana]|uniref:1327_t:CDS:1 n=1 Tax=Acaulospora colombiana TaxID=27376 RepID=A0ACA9KH91_9GLOM|nr:1327_t:CDS:2 [Acaulospora colombiana]